MSVKTFPDVGDRGLSNGIKK